MVAAMQAQETGEALQLSRWCWAEQREGGWVVRDRRNLADHDSLLGEVAIALWTDEEYALKFPTPQEAWAAYIRSQSLHVSRRGRRATAMRRLGRQ
jgi:hypothetical protein